jgi:hypothetical protein
VQIASSLSMRLYTRNSMHDLLVVLHYVVFKSSCCDCFIVMTLFYFNVIVTSDDMIWLSWVRSV